MSLSMKSIDPDALTAHMSLTGLPCGLIADRETPEELAIRAGSLDFGSNQDVRLKSCGQPDSRNEARCGDLHMYAGKSRVNYATGEQIGYSFLHTELLTDNGLDHYPFDTWVLRASF